MHKRKLDVKFFAFDEFLAFIGGNLSLVLGVVGIFFYPFSQLEFILNNSTYKDEMLMVIGQAKEGKKSQSISKFKASLELQKKFFANYWTLYFSNFLPSSCFREKSREIINEYQAEEDEIKSLSSLYDIHLRLEQIDNFHDLDGSAYEDALKRF